MTRCWQRVELVNLPGADLVLAGLDALDDMAQGKRDEWTPEALLVAIGARRLRAAGLAMPDVPTWPAQPELALYEALAEAHPDAHSRYNALIRRLVSFERALEAGSTVPNRLYTGRGWAESRHAV